MTDGGGIFGWRSWAPASAASAWRSASSNPGSRTSSCSSATREVGGTWWANTYPGCQCDIPSHLYSYSFAPNSEWTRTYPLQPEIREYLRDCTDRFGLRPHIRFNCPVQSAEWDQDAGVWQIETPDGSFSAQMLVGAPGPLSEPSIPSLPGHRRVPGRRVSHRPLGPLAGSDRSQSRGDRDGGVRDPDRPADPAAGQAPDDLPADRAVGGAAPRPSDHRVRAPAVPARAGGAARRADDGLRQPRGARAGTRLPPAVDERGAEDGGGPPRQAGARRGAPREAHARLRDRLQAHPALEQVVSGDCSAQRRGRHERGHVVHS